VAYRRHRDAVGLAGRLNNLAVRENHRLREGTLEPAGHGRPLAVRSAEPDRVLLDPVVGRERPHVLQVLDVLLNAFALVAIGPVYYDILRVALVEVLPLLTGVDAEVQVIEVRKVLRERGRDPLNLWGGLANPGSGPKIFVGGSSEAGADQQGGGKARAKSEIGNTGSFSCHFFHPFFLGLCVHGARFLIDR